MGKEPKTTSVEVDWRGYENVYVALSLQNSQSSSPLVRQKFPVMFCSDLTASNRWGPLKITYHPDCCTYLDLLADGIVNFGITL